MRLFLSEHTGDANFGTLIYLRVDDVDAFVAGLEGVGERVEEQEFGMRDVEVEDLDRNRIRIGSRVRVREG